MVPTSTIPVLIRNLPNTTPNMHKLTTTRSGKVFQLSKRYDVRINTNIKAFLFQLVEVLAITD